MMRITLNHRSGVGLSSALHSLFVLEDVVDNGHSGTADHQLLVACTRGNLLECLFVALSAGFGHLAYTVGLSDSPSCVERSRHIVVTRHNARVL